MKKRKKLGILFPVLLLLASGCVGCGAEATPYQNTDFAMGTVISQNIYGKKGEETADQVMEQLKELEQTISWRMEDSEIARINEAAGTGTQVPVSEKTGKWLTDCQEVWKKTDGALDITIGAVARLWDIGGDNPRIPKTAELEAALKTVGGENYRIEKESVIYEAAGGQLDLGAVGKGIACDEIAELLKAEKAEVNGTFSVGGSVLIYGNKLNGKNWKIGIRDPRGEEGEYMGALSFSQEEGDCTFVSTSGDYEKYFEKDGVRYHHILDPKTGAPADSDLISVTVISKSGFLSDALSTACFVAGREKAMEFADLFQVDLVLIDNEGTVTVTKGAEATFERLNEEYRLEQ